MNLVYGAFALNHEPEQLVDSLLDGLSTSRIELDLHDFLARADVMAACGMSVLISDYFQYYREVEPRRR